MMQKIFPFILIIILLITGCSSSSSPTTISATMPVTDNIWTVKMTHSGGIMGLMRSVEVSSNGNYIVTDERTKQTITDKLPADELATLNKLVTNAEYATAQKPVPSGCADCFVYDIEMQGGGKKFAVQLDDISLPGSGMELLVTFLRELIDTALG